MPGEGAGAEAGARAGGLYSEVQCIMGNGHMGTPFPLWTDGQAGVKTSPSHNFVGGRNEMNHHRI